ncbi:hypothetical protein MLD38_017191 [Melastoma candidum]|uniref:Uncharacterized protein n=1 Tax=Melastoma candidum TaxID=119954 RepID=A0ACB9QP24_9MYRT|nr:hypothetical protein MLD38_017191 [Melastoma candidum]
MELSAVTGSLGSTRIISALWRSSGGLIVGWGSRLGYVRLLGCQDLAQYWLVKDSTSTRPQVNCSVASDYRRAYRFLGTSTST